MEHPFLSIIFTFAFWGIFFFSERVDGISFCLMWGYSIASIILSVIIGWKLFVILTIIILFLYAVCTWGTLTENGRRAFITVGLAFPVLVFIWVILTKGLWNKHLIMSYINSIRETLEIIFGWIGIIVMIGGYFWLKNRRERPHKDEGVDDVPDYPGT